MYEFSVWEAKIGQDTKYPTLDFFYNTPSGTIDFLNFKHPISTDLDISFLTVLGQEWFTVLTGLYSPFRVFLPGGELRPVINYFL